MKLTKEQIEENLACYKQAMETGTVEGIESSDKGDEWMPKRDYRFCYGVIYRRKPAVTLRPWKPEEVPLGATVRWKGVGPWMGTITGRDSAGVCAATSWLHYDQLKESCEHTFDGPKAIANGTATWLLCGVEEGR